MSDLLGFDYSAAFSSVQCQCYYLLRPSNLKTIHLEYSQTCVTIFLGLFNEGKRNLKCITGLRSQLKLTLLANVFSLLLQAWSQGNHGCRVSDIKPNLIFQTGRPDFSCAVNMAAGRSGDSEDARFRCLIDKVGELWDGSPEPVKSFPWNRALENFIQLVVDLTLAVVKILCVPLLGITSLSEMSYCAHERKLFFVPLALIIGFAVAGILKDTALEISPFIKVTFEIAYTFII